MLTIDTQRSDRKLRFWLVVVSASCAGLRVAMDAYSGPSVALGLTIALGFGTAMGLLSLRLGDRVWRFLEQSG